MRPAAAGGLVGGQTGSGASPSVTRTLAIRGCRGTFEAAKKASYSNPSPVCRAAWADTSIEPQSQRAYGNKSYPLRLRPFLDHRRTPWLVFEFAPDRLSIYAIPLGSFERALDGL